MDWLFGLHILIDLLVAALGIPVMPTVNRDYLKLVLLYVYVNRTTALGYSNRTGPKSKIVPSRSAQTR